MTDNKNFDNEIINEQQLGCVSGGDDGRLIGGGSGDSAPSGGRGGTKKMKIICPECGRTVEVTVSAFSDEVTCPVCKKSFKF